MHETLLGSECAGKQERIPIDSITNYGIFDGSRDSLTDLVMSITYISPLTWVTKHVDDDDPKDAKVLFFSKPKTQLADEGIKPKCKNADVVIEEGDAWITFWHAIEGDGKSEFRCGFTTVDKKDIADLMLHDFMEDHEMEDMDDEEFFKLFELFIENIGLE